MSGLRESEHDWRFMSTSLGGLEVDHQVDFRDLLNRQISRLVAFEDTAGVDANTIGIVVVTAFAAPPAQVFQTVPRGR